MSGSMLVFNFPTLELCFVHVKKQDTGTPCLKNIGIRAFFQLCNKLDWYLTARDFVTPPKFHLPIVSPAHFHKPGESPTYCKIDNSDTITSIEGDLKRPMTNPHGA